MTIKAHFIIQSVSEFCNKFLVAEKNSDSTDLGLIVIKAWNSSSSLVDLFFVTSKTRFLFHNL